MAGITLNFFGKAVHNAERLALDKFRNCPWPHFDGVPDPQPNRLLASDFAVTIVMNSGIRMQQVWDVLDRVDGEAVSLLTAIPVKLALESTSEQKDCVPWSQIDQLFQRLMGTRARLSRIAKTLCRKRPQLIPMLDNVVTRFLKTAARSWRANGPAWFPLAWDSWATWEMPSPYIRMIRHDMQAQLDQLKRLRSFLAAAQETEVPKDAPLLRIYEATLFWWLLQ